MTQEYFAIKLSHSLRLALPLEDMTLVTRFGRSQICPIPSVSPFWLGVVNQGGSLLWVLDSDLFFQLTPDNFSPEKHLTTVILARRLGATERRVALTIRGLQGVVALDASSPSESLSLPLLPRFLPLFSAIVQDNQKPLGILNSEALLSMLHAPSNGSYQLSVNSYQ